MGKLTNLNPPAPIADSDYLTIAEGDSRYTLAPSFLSKEILITGTVNTSPGDTMVAHGITGVNIVGILCTIWDQERGWRMPPGYINTGYNYFAYVTDTHFIIYVPGTVDSQRALGKPFKAILTYLT
jgi:hypothetical protein